MVHHFVLVNVARFLPVFHFCFNFNFIVLRRSLQSEGLLCAKRMPKNMQYENVLPKCAHLPKGDQARQSRFTGTTHQHIRQANERPIASNSFIIVHVSLTRFLRMFSSIMVTFQKPLHSYLILYCSPDTFHFTHDPCQCVGTNGGLMRDQVIE